MNSNEFRKAAHSAVEDGRLPARLSRFLADDIIVIEYFETLDDRRVLSNVSPGYLKTLLPTGPPEEGEKWSEIHEDIESKIMPGLTHWYC